MNEREVLLGNRLVIGVIGISLSLEVFSFLFGFLNQGLNLSHLIRMGLGLWVCSNLYRGKVWAKWVWSLLIFLVGLSFVGRSWSLVGEGSVGLGFFVASIGVVYIACAFTLFVVPSVRSYFSHVSQY